MVVFSEDCLSWGNVRFVCVECLETTWKGNERLNSYRVHQQMKTGFNPNVRWWTCKGCWK